MQRKMVCLTMLTLMICGSCTAKNITTDQASTTTGLSASDINQTMVVSAPDGWNSYLIGEGVHLAVELKKDTQVIIDERDTRIFLHDNNNWIPVNNGIGNPTVIVIVYSPPWNSGLVSVGPDLADQAKPVTLRFVVTGHIYENNILGEMVQAYVDVELHP